MKKGLIVVAVVVVLIILGFAIFGDSKTASETEVTDTPTVSEPRKPGVRVIGADEIESGIQQ